MGAVVNTNVDPWPPRYGSAPYAMNTEWEATPAGGAWSFPLSSRAYREARLPFVECGAVIEWDAPVRPWGGSYK